jgi:hypothetical protein
LLLSQLVVDDRKPSLQDGVLCLRVVGDVWKVATSNRPPSSLSGLYQ